MKLRLLTASLLLLLSVGGLKTELVSKVVAEEVAAGVTALVKVDAFTPQGEIKGVRQVVARFSAPMVAFGDPRLPDPFTIQCPATGHGRWADDRNWIYDFDEDLPAGLSCSFKTKPGIKNPAQQSLQAGEYRFNTGGPQVLRTLPRQGSSDIDEAQIFLLGLDTHADIASVQQHAYCSIPMLGERIPLQILDGTQRSQVLRENADEIKALFRAWDKPANKKLAVEELPLIAARCSRKLPTGSDVTLVWGKGIRSVTGLAANNEQQLTYQVRPAFSARTHCSKTNEQAGCIPVRPLVLAFSAPVSRALAEAIRLHGLEGSMEPRLNADEGEDSINSVEFPGPFQPNQEVKISLPVNFHDDAGRHLENAQAFPLKVRIDEDPPLIKFPSRFGILELNAQPMLPVTVRNVEAEVQGVQLQIAQKQSEKKASATKTAAANNSKASAGQGLLGRLDSDDDRVLAEWVLRMSQRYNYNDAEYRAFQKKHERHPREGELPLLLGKPHAAEFNAQAIKPPLSVIKQTPEQTAYKPFEVLGIPLEKPGFYVVEFASNRLGAALHAENKPYYVASSALVTNMAVHLKAGRESSLVWVTQLDNAKPVAKAAIRVSTCDGRPLWQGETDAQGMAHINEELAVSAREYQGCEGWLVTARKGEDMSFMRSAWDDGISPWQFNLGGGASARPLLAHTVLDRPLFRAGETVSMKHFLRLHASQGLKLPKEHPAVVLISHDGSGEEYEVPIKWSASAGTSTWVIPKEAKLGTYRLTLKTQGEWLDSGSFRVEQYRVPLMQAQLKPPAQPVVNARQLSIDAQLNYLAGGAAAGAPVKFRSRMVDYPQQFAAYDDFTFGGSVPKLGIEAVQPYDYEAEVEEGSGTAQVKDYAPRSVSMTLDEHGGARVSFDKLPQGQAPRALEIEMEYSDPNGKILTAATRAVVLPSALTLGIKPEGYYASKDKLSFKVLALDTAGKPVSGRKVAVEAYSRKTHAYRKRMLGGFYAYEQTAKVERLGEICSGSTDAHGLLSCNDPAPDSGELILVAKAKDQQGNQAIASQEFYVAEEGHWFDATQSDRIDILPNKREYEPGEKARFEVRMPFREATALVTIEREGVLDAFVQPISAKSPYVDVPIAEHYGPNAYVSVMVVRGRVDPEVPGAFAWMKRMVYRVGMFLGLVKRMPTEIDTRPTALVDLTKPAFKLGLAQIKVGWQAYSLKVKVEADRETYHVRDQANIKVTVNYPNGKPAANAEVALAAVDEGLLQLAKPESWDLLEAMMLRRPIEVYTSTAQSQVIGKRHFGKKAVAAGGGGGQGANARELFDTLLLWQPVLKLDAQGQARVQVPLNDALTSFRIAAIAHAGDMRFGSASTNIRSSQDVMLFAGLPPFVREGDQFTALTTVRNGGERSLTLDVSASATSQQQPGLAQPGIQPSALQQSQRVTVAAGQALEVAFPIKVPLDITQLDWHITAREVQANLDASPDASRAQAPAADALKFSQQVGAATPVQVYQRTMEQLLPEQAWRMPVSIPKGAIAGRGGLDVQLSRSLVGDLAGVREYMQRYPYSCMEQRASVAVALEDKARWEKAMNSLPAHLDRDGLARYFPIDWLQGDDTLTAYLLSIADEAGYEIPQLTRERMLKGLEDFVAGRVQRYGYLRTSDLVLRKLAAIAALARYKRANASMLQALEINPNLWPSSGVIDWASLLHRMQDVPEREAKLQQALDILRARMTFSGTSLNFSSEKQDHLWWLMVTPELNAVRALNLLTETQSQTAADAGRLARGAQGLQEKGRWSTTVANAWGVLAMRHFQQRYEREAVQGSSQVTLGQQQRTLSWQQATNAEQAESASNAEHGSSQPLAPRVHGAGLGPMTSLAWPASPESLALQHQGSGKPWAFVTARAALPLDKPLFAGYKLKRTVTVVEQKTRGRWQRGDIYRVKLELEAQTDMTWVVINDPIPAGASVLGTGLGDDSAQLTAGEKRGGWERPAFEERAFDGFRAYYAYLPKGKVSIEYPVRLNNAGRFAMPASRVEAMYAPENFAELPVASMEVSAK